FLPAQLEDSPMSMTLDSENQIIVSGKSKNIDDEIEIFVARFSSNGTIDSTFAVNGVYHSVGAAGGTEDVGSSVQIDSSSRYVVAGSSLNSAGTGRQLAIWRIRANGALDSSFGSSGKVLFGSTGAAGGTDTQLE